jgi:hypothetical protein
LVEIPLKIATFGALLNVPLKIDIFGALSNMPQKITTFDTFKCASKICIHIYIKV